MPDSRATLERKILDALEGTLPRRAMSPGYRLGVIAITAAAVALPVIYGLLILALAAAGVVYAQTAPEIFLQARPRGITGTLMVFAVFLAPAVTILLLLALLVRPILRSFGRRREEDPWPAISAEKEPFLYAFVDRVCRLVGAPRAERVLLTMDANAFAGGGGRLAVGIGAPLLAGLTLRELVGILGHESAHLSQRLAWFGDRTVRRICGGFESLLEDDAFDGLLEMGDEEHGCGMFTVGILILVLVARLGLWLVRKFIGGLLSVARLLEAAMSRQMEHDSDAAEIALVGAATFEATCRKLPLLEMSLMYAHWTLQEGGARSLPDDLAGYTAWLAGSCPERIREWLARRTNAEQESLLDSHPSLARRIEAARRIGGEGRFCLDLPATALLRDPGALLRSLTERHYRDWLEGDFKPGAVVPLETFTGQRGEKRRQGETVLRWTAGCRNSLRRWGFSDRFVEGVRGAEDAREVLGRVRSEFLAHAAAWRAEIEVHDKDDDLLLTGARCGALLEAARRRPGLSLPLRKVEMAVKLGAEAAARRAAGEERLRPAEEALAARVAAVLAWLPEPWLASARPPDLDRMEPLVRAAFRFLDDTHADLMEARLKAAALGAWIDVQAAEGIGKAGAEIVQEGYVGLRGVLRRLRDATEKAEAAFQAMDPEFGITRLLPRAVVEGAAGAQIHLLIDSFYQARRELSLWALEWVANAGEKVEEALGFPPLPIPEGMDRAWG